MSETATTDAAREHARSQAGRTERFQRTVPAPAGLLWQETVEGGNYAVHRVPRGCRIKLTDISGDTCVQMVVFNARNTAERYNVADTVKVQWQAYLTAGQLLLSDMGRVLMSIEDDSSAGHDTFNAMSNKRWNDEKYGSGSVHGASPNARDRFAVGLAKFGLERRDIPAAVNLFKPVRVGSDGSFEWGAAPTPEGAITQFRCEMDLIVAVTVTPHVLDPRPDYVVGPLAIEAWQGPVTPPDDPIRTSSPEGTRAFENTEAWIASNSSDVDQNGVAR